MQFKILEIYYQKDFILHTKNVKILIEMNLCGIEVYVNKFMLNK